MEKLIIMLLIIMGRFVIVFMAPINPLFSFILNFSGLFVNRNNYLCQEQIDLSGFVANELSAFTVLEWRAI
jgi:hypothetical protein